MKGIKCLFLVFALLLTSSITCLAQTAEEKAEIDSLWNDWNFRINPYFWLIGLKGEIIRPPQPANPIEVPSYDIDVGFKDIASSIKFALMLSGQYKSDKIIAQFNFSTLIMESRAITPAEIILQGSTVNLKYYSGDLGIGYRFVKTGKFELDALGVLKFIRYDISLSTNLAGNVPVVGERGRSWMDPSLGLNFKYRPFKRTEFMFYGDLGSTIFATDFSYQTIFAFNYLFSKSFLATIGYRYYYVSVPEDEAIYNGSVRGLIVRIGFQF